MQRAGAGLTYQAAVDSAPSPLLPPAESSGDITGSAAVLNAGRGVLGAAYSREAEANADHFAVDVMKNLGRSPKALGTLLLRITGPEKDNPLSIFASHPLTEERLAMFAAEAPSEDLTSPSLLSPGEWQALKDICK